MEDIKKKTIGQIVAANYKTASVFKKYNIDFCCNGNRTIEEAISGKKLDKAVFISEIEAENKLPAHTQIDYQLWPLDLLADYIEKKHHRYVIAQIPILTEYLNKLCMVHGQQHPELLEIKDLFTDSATELLNHMKKEELILFPFIRKLELANAHYPLVQGAFGSVQNPILMMMQEHDTEGERFRKINSLSNSYTPPFDACNTYRVAFALLKEFEEDLHLHIHLENNILFPKTIEQEKTLN